MSISFSGISKKYKVTFSPKFREACNRVGFEPESIISYEIQQEMMPIYDMRGDVVVHSEIIVTTAALGSVTVPYFSEEPWATLTGR